MQEYTLTAVVLEKAPLKEQDVVCVLYTKEFGRIRATAHGGRRITSKLAAHLEPLTVSHVRLVGGAVADNGGLRFSIADALTIRKLDAVFFPILRLVAQMTPWQEVDLDLWQELMNEGPIPSGRRLLSIFGFDTQNARCEFCGRPEVAYFVFDGFFYTCADCPPPALPASDYFALGV